MHDGEDADRANDGTETGGAPRVGVRTKDTRWKPNQSGNPNGRPKGSKNKLPAEKQQKQSRLAKLALEKVAGTGFTMIDAFLRTQMINAIKGDAKAARLLAGLFKDYKVFDTLPKQAINPVLIVPSMNAEDWAKSVDEHQAQYRGNQGEERRIK